MDQEVPSTLCVLGNILKLERKFSGSLAVFLEMLEHETSIFCALGSIGNISSEIILGRFVFFFNCKIISTNIWRRPKQNSWIIIANKIIILLIANIKRNYNPSTTTIVRSSFWIRPDLIISSTILFNLSWLGVCWYFVI